MTIRQRRRFAASTSPQNRAADERRQRDFELNEALKAARALQARLELLGDRAVDVEAIRALRDSLVRDLIALDVVVGGPPYTPSSTESPRTGDGSSS